jgi:hypothetical protein
MNTRFAAGAVEPRGRTAVASLGIARLLWSNLLVLSAAGGACAMASTSARAGDGVPGRTVAAKGLDHEVWIARRTDGQRGAGTADDPLDGSTRAKFDSIMNGYWKAGARNITLHLGAGTFETVGSYVYAAHDPTPGWRADDGWKIVGAGMGNTILKLAGYTYLDPAFTEVTVTNGVWATRRDNWYQIGQELLLSEGKNMTGLQPDTTYHVTERLDSIRFKVSATPGGPTIADAAIGSRGRVHVIGKSAANCVIANNPWNKEDVEVRDLTIDCNWTGFGASLAAPFTVPGEMQTVTVEVESNRWAQVNKWVYIQQLDYTPIGAYEVVSIPNSTQLVLRNLRNGSLPGPVPGQPDLRFGDNAAPGKPVAKGARICPRLNVSGVGLSARRAKIERVRVTNVGAPIYEGPCGITVVGIGEPKSGWPAASEIVIRDCVVDDIWGQYGWVIQVHGNNVDWPSKGYGTQAIVEGNTIYGNGLHQGLGGWNYVSSIWANNKVVNCAASFFTDTAHCWNNIIRNNLFLECKSYTMILGGGPAAWKADTQFKPADSTCWNNLYYTCRRAHTNQPPPDRVFWTEMPNQAHSGWNTYVFENNLIEICDHSGPLLFNGGVAGAIFRNNILRYAAGHGQGSEGLRFANPSNRRLIVTGNVIDSRLKNSVGKSVVFGKDNIDENGRLRRELEIGEHATAQKLNN